jgi:hypothetical protein
MPAKNVTLALQRTRHINPKQKYYIMQNSKVVTPEQQRYIAQKINDELEKMTMSWTPELRSWHKVAIASLDFASATSLRIPQQMYCKLFGTTVHGLNMNVVSVLFENIARMKPSEMGFDAKAWSLFLLKNHDVTTRWMELMRPVEKTVYKQFEIMSATPILAKA